MIRLTDKALADIRADSEQGLPPGIGDTQLMVAEIAALKAECEGLRAQLAAVYPFKPAQDRPVIGYTGCVICGKYTDHGGLQCPETLAFSLSRDNQRVVPPEPIIAEPHPLDGKGGQSNG